ncbi:MAG: hypothetical protein KG003_12210 [Bacteroidetes bacterium]|nr:hypothetical protein [Bacteroidota bacterium]
MKIKGESTIQRMRSLFQISSIIPFGIFRDEKPLAFYCTNCGRLDYKLPLDRMQKLNKRIEKVQQKSTQN